MLPGLQAIQMANGEEMNDGLTVAGRKLLNRVMRKVLVRGPDECWPWMGFRNQNGQSQTGYWGRTTSASRLIYMLITQQELDKKEFVCHKCDNPWCCNFNHFFLGDQHDNMRDCVSKGRNVHKTHPESFPRGEKSFRAKLTSSEVAEIRAMLAAGMGPTAIHKTGKFSKVTRANINQIKHNRSWKPCPQPHQNY